MRFPAGLRALNHDGFRRLFAAQTLSQIGSWMQSVAQTWFVLQLTNSPFLLGLLGTLQWGPILFFSLVSGAVVDRLSQRRLLIATNVTFAGQALVLALVILSGHAAYWQFAILAAVAGLANTIDQPARQTFVLALVGREDVINAVALSSAGFNAARVVGPAVAGLLIAKVGVAPTYVVSGLSFLVVIVTLLRLAEPAPSARRRDATLIDEMREGVAYALRTPRVRLILGLLFVIGVTVYNFVVYVPLLARTVLGLGPQGFGLLMTALGTGAVAGALTIGARRSVTPSPAFLLTTAALACGGLLGLGAARRLAVVVPLLALTGFFGIIMVAASNTALQLEAPDELRGRVVSLYTWVYGGTFPVGVLVTGAISERAGVSIALYAAGTSGLAALALLAGWWRWRAGRRPAAPRRADV
jgi:predicted MFS family arabinose efflux permease